MLRIILLWPKDLMFVKSVANCSGHLLDSVIMLSTIMGSKVKHLERFCVVSVAKVSCQTVDFEDISSKFMVSSTPVINVAKISLQRTG
jgi:hypothetical protein